MTKEYRHLSLMERQLLFNWYHYQKKSMREIARLLDRSHSTISREIKRNMTTYYVPTYYPHPAHHQYLQRIRARARRTKLKSIEIRNYVIEKLNKKATHL